MFAAVFELVIPANRPTHYTALPPGPLHGLTHKVEKGAENWNINKNLK
jgi:hypothetical protein